MSWEWGEIPALVGAGCNIISWGQFLPLHLLQDQVLVQISVCLKEMWLNCFHVSFFSCFLGFSFLFIGNRLWCLKASLQHWWPLHMEVAESLLCIMFYRCFYSLKSGFSLKFKAKFHGWVILLGDPVWHNDRTSLWCGWVSQSLCVPCWASLGSDTSLAGVTPSEDASVVRNSGVHPPKLLFLLWPDLQDLVFSSGISYFCS